MDSASEALTSFQGIVSPKADLQCNQWDPSRVAQQDWSPFWFPESSISLLGLSYNMHMQRNGGNTGWGDPSTKHNPTTPRQTPRTETKGPEGAVRSAGRVLTYPRAEALMGRCQHGGLRLSGPPLSLFRADCGTPRGLSEP